MMKKFIISLTLLFLTFFGFSQGVIVRASATNTVEDFRLMAGYNLFIPAFSDTVTANAQKGIDSAGGIIFDRSINGFRIRRSGTPKHWDYITDSTLFATITALKDTAATLRALIASSGVGAGGNNTDIQFNNHGAFGGNDSVQFDGTNVLIGFNKNVALKKGDYLYFNGVDTTWKIQLITTSGSDHIITGNELRLTIPTTSEGFSINNGAGVPSFQVQGSTGLAYVRGNLQVGAVQYPNTDGISGQVLTTNGTGTPTFQTPSANGITALTGDVTASGTGSVLATLATVNSNPNTFGDSTKTLVVTVNAKGLVTSIIAKPILISQSQILNPNITGLVAGGTSIAISGSGTSGSPYVINSTAAGTGTVTSVTAGAALTGGTFTTSGTIGADTSVLVTKTALIDSLVNFVKAPIPNSSLQHSAIFVVPSNGITVGSSDILTLGNTVSIGIDTVATIATQNYVNTHSGGGTDTTINAGSGLIKSTSGKINTYRVDSTLFATKNYVNQQDTIINAGAYLTQTYVGAIKSINADTTIGKIASQTYVNTHTGATPALLAVTTVGNTTNGINFLPQTIATPNPAHGNTVFDSSGFNIRDSAGKTATLSKALVTISVRDSFQNKSGRIALLSDITAAATNTLQQVTAANDSTTYPAISLDTIKGAAIYSSGGGYFGDSSKHAIMYVSVSGASVEVGQNASPLPAARWSSLFCADQNFGELNRAISGKSFQRKTVGDSSFVDLFPTYPVYADSVRWYIIGASNFLNDCQLHTGYTTLAATVDAYIDSIHFNRGAPYNRIVVVTPSLDGIHTFNGGPAGPDSLIFYVNQVIIAARARPVILLDTYDYMVNNGGSTLVSSDSIHPNTLGHAKIALNAQYRLGDVSFSANINARLSAFFGGNVRDTGYINSDSSITAKSKITSIGGAQIGASVVQGAAPFVAGTISTGLTGAGNPYWGLFNSGGGTDKKYWMWRADTAGILHMSLYNDILNAPFDIINISRTLATSASAAFAIPISITTPAAVSSITLMQQASTTLFSIVGTITTGNGLWWLQNVSSSVGIQEQINNTSTAAGAYNFRRMTSNGTAGTSSVGESFQSGTTSIKYNIGQDLSDSSFSIGTGGDVFNPWAVKAFVYKQGGRTGINGILNPQAGLEIPKTSALFPQILIDTDQTVKTAARSGAVGNNGSNITYTDKNLVNWNLANTSSATATLDFPSTGGGASSDLTITLTGAVVGDAVALGSAVPAANSMFTVFVSSSNTITVRYLNIGAIPIDPASATYKVTIIR